MEFSVSPKLEHDTEADDSTNFPSRSQIERIENNMSWTLISQISNQVPQTPSVSNGDNLHPVYMSEEDINRLIQSGQIIFTGGRLHYKHTN